MNTRLVNTAADVILTALTQNRTAAGIALALDSAQLLMCPETAAEMERLRERVAELEAAQAFVPQTERSRWVDIADVLNAAHDAGMPVSIDLDGTLTDHRGWSVVWDRETERWTVAGYEDAEECRHGLCDPSKPFAQCPVCHMHRNLPMAGGAE